MEGVPFGETPAGLEHAERLPTLDASANFPVTSEDLAGTVSLVGQDVQGTLYGGGDGGPLSRVVARGLKRSQVLLSSRSEISNWKKKPQNSF